MSSYPMAGCLFLLCPPHWLASAAYIMPPELTKEQRPQTSLPQCLVMVPYSFPESSAMSKQNQ